MRSTAILICLAALLGLAAAAPAQEPGKGFLWDGTHWQQISLDGKVGYVWGVGNLADFENAASQGRAPCVSKAFVDELKSRTVMQIVQEVDKFYQEHPDKLKTSVMEVILVRCTSACPPALQEGAKKN